MNNFKKTFGKEVVVKNLEEMKVFSGVFLENILERCKQDETMVVGLSGDLGVGKTTFSKAIAQELGVEETVTSPTFGIQKQYKVTNLHFLSLFEDFIHIDAYRIEDIKEVDSLRFTELFQKPKTLIFIEWPEKIAPVLPDNTIVLSFESIDENTRKIFY